MRYRIGETPGELGTPVEQAFYGAGVFGLLLGIGFVIAGMLSMPLSNFFYQVEPWDWTIFAVIAALLSMTGVLAAFAPARRATRVDPLVALRDE